MKCPPIWYFRNIRDEIELKGHSGLVTLPIFSSDYKNKTFCFFFCQKWVSFYLVPKYVY